MFCLLLHVSLFLNERPLVADIEAKQKVYETNQFNKHRCQCPIERLDSSDRSYGTYPHYEYGMERCV